MSVTLRKLRIKYDNMNKLVRERERELEELKVGERIYHWHDLFSLPNFGLFDFILEKIRVEE